MEHISDTPDQSDACVRCQVGIVQGKLDGLMVTEPCDGLQRTVFNIHF